MASMKKAQVNTIVILILGAMLVACGENHERDGLYMANKQIAGIKNVWILNGNEVTVYSMGVIKVGRCKQHGEKIVMEDGREFPFNEKGDVIITKGTGPDDEYSMTKISSKTDYSPEQIEKLIDEALEKEVKGDK
jgi:hypothetical protein